MRTVIAGVVALLVVSHTFRASAEPAPGVTQYVKQAWTLYKRGDCRGAQRVLNDALTIAPEWEPLYFNLGVSAESCGSGLLAANYYRKYANIDPHQREWVTAHAVLLEQSAQTNTDLPTAAPARRGFPWWGWALIGVGVAGLASVLVLTLSDTTDSDYGI